MPLKPNRIVPSAISSQSRYLDPFLGADHDPDVTLFIIDDVYMLTF